MVGAGKYVRWDRHVCLVAALVLKDHFCAKASVFARCAISSIVEVVETDVLQAYSVTAGVVAADPTKFVAHPFLTV